MHTVGCRRYVCQSSGVRARAVCAASSRAHGERVRRARGEAGDVERCRVSARVHRDGARGRTRRVEEHCVVGDVTVCGCARSPRQGHRCRHHGHGGETRWNRWGLKTKSIVEY